MQCIVMRQAYDGFHFVLKKHLKLSQKIDFLAQFERLLVDVFLRTMSYPNLLPNEISYGGT